MCAQGKRRRTRWFQFSLRSLLLAVTATIVLLAVWRIYMAPYERQAAAIARIQALGGSCQSQAEGPAWLRRLLGDGRIQIVTHVNLADCDEPEKYIDHVARLPRVETLFVGGLHFGDADLARLHGLSTLRGLILDTTTVSDAGIAECSSPLGKCMVRPPP